MGYKNVEKRSVDGKLKIYQQTSADLVDLIPDGPINNSLKEWLDDYYFPNTIDTLFEQTQAYKAQIDQQIIDIKTILGI